MIPIITERAASDIVGIFDFLGETSAKKVVLEIEKAIEHLETSVYGANSRRAQDRFEKFGGSPVRDFLCCVARNGGVASCAAWPSRYKSRFSRRFKLINR
jgi:hypothetical protein